MARGFCSPEQIAQCPLVEHYTDEHHLWWPARNYRDRTGSAFRELPENKEQKCRHEHNELHANQQPPDKPDRLRMLAVLAFNEVDVASYALKEATHESQVDG